MITVQRVIGSKLELNRIKLKVENKLPKINKELKFIYNKFRAK